MKKIALKIEKMIQWFGMYGAWMYKIYTFILNAVLGTVVSLDMLATNLGVAMGFGVEALLLYVLAYQNTRIKDWWKSCSLVHIEQQCHLVKLVAMPFVYLVYAGILYFIEKNIGYIGFVNFLFVHVLNNGFVKVFGIHFLCDQVAKKVAKSVYKRYERYFSVNFKQFHELDNFMDNYEA